MDTSWIQPGYESANDGDWEPFKAHLTEDYVHNIPGLGITWKGRDDAVKGVHALYDEYNLKQTAQSVSAHGTFIIVKVLMTSSLREGTQEVVHVYRTDADKIAEVWALAPPAA